MCLKSKQCLRSFTTQLLKCCLLLFAVGYYQASVTASNNLGSEKYDLPMLIYVETAPSGTALEEEEYKTYYGNETTFKLSITAGTNVKFDWTMGDGTVLIDHGNIARPMENPFSLQVLIECGVC